MESNDEYMKDLLRDENTELPPGFSWGEMKAGIGEAMARQAEPKRDRKKLLFWWWILPAAVGSLALLYFAIGLPGKEQPLAAPTAILENTSAAENAQNERRSTENRQAPTFAEPQENKLPAQKEDMPVTKRGAVLPEQVLQIKDASNTSFDAGINPPAKIMTPTAGNSAIQPDRAMAPATDLPANPANANLISNDHQLVVVKTINSLANRELQLLAEIEPKDQKPSFMELPELVKIKPIQSTTAAIGFRYGMSYTLLPAKSKYALPANITAKETGLLGSFAQVYYQKNIFKNLSARVGLEWRQFNRQLDYESVANTQVHEEGVVLLRKINVITGDTVNVLGDTTVNAVATRTVRHFNQSAAYQLPVALGYRWQGSKLDFGVEAGAVFNLLTQHSGLTYNQSGELVAIASDGAFLKNRTGILVNAGLQAGYRISPRLRLHCQLDIAKAMSDWSAESGVDIRPAALSAGLGIHWMLK